MLTIKFKILAIEEFHKLLQIKIKYFKMIVLLNQVQIKA
jgi:hypothetical protein